MCSGSYGRGRTEPVFPGGPGGPATTRIAHCRAESATPGLQAILHRARAIAVPARPGIGAGGAAQTVVPSDDQTSTLVFTRSSTASVNSVVVA
jgi:hypothetical protein